MLFFIILLTAIGDEFNASKSGELQLFHTKVKPFNVLHPNGIFASNPEYLNIDGMDIVNIPPGVCVFRIEDFKRGGKSHMALTNIIFKIFEGCMDIME